MRMRKSLKITALITALLVLQGCSLLKFSSSKKTKYPIPLKPKKSEKLKEATRANVDYAKNVLDHVYESGVKPKNEAVRQASKSLSIVQSDIGVPSDPIEVELEKVDIKSISPQRLNSGVPNPPIPDSFHYVPVRSEKAEEAQVKLQSQVKKRRKDLERYDDKLDNIRRKMMGMEEKETSSVSSPFLSWFGGTSFILLIVGAIVLLILFPIIGFKVIRFAIERAIHFVEVAAKEGYDFLEDQFGQLTEGVQDFMDRDDVPEEDKKKLKESLKKNTSHETKKKIDEIKRDRGLKEIHNGE